MTALVLKRRLQRAVRVHGVKGTAHVVTRRVRTTRARRRRPRLDAESDRRRGVDTDGIVPREALSIESPTRDLGVRYQPTSPDGFRALMAQAPIGEGELTFVDLGSGKGRPLLLASELPFR